MKELKVGMYVRTNYRREKVIRKIVNIVEDGIVHDHRLIFDKPTQYTYYVEDGYFVAKECTMNLLEENDLLSIEYYSPRYEERVTRLFEVDFKYDKYISLTNSHCTFNLTNGEYSELDKKLNPIIKSVVTKEQFNSVKYEVE